MVQSTRMHGLRLSIQALTSILLLAGALLGLFFLNAQIEIFSFGSQWPDARTVPQALLALLAITVAVRLVRHRADRETSIGRARSHGRVFLVAAAAALAIWSMPAYGFLPGSVAAGVVTAWALGERRLLLLAGIPLAIAAAVVYGGRYGLNIPLP